MTELNNIKDIIDAYTNHLTEKGLLDYATGIYLKSFLRHCESHGGERIETLFSQLCDQFMIIRNYAKETEGLFTRIIGKISAMTILQYINYKNGRPIGRVKYALI